jgi:MFS family permease
VTRERPPGAVLQLAALSAAMILGMTPWFSATVAAPGMIAEWRHSGAVSAWLTIAVQLGFVLGTFVSAVLLLSDRWSARRLAAVSSLVAAATTACLAAPSIEVDQAIALRVVTGAALAGVYPPGIKIAAGWWLDRRGTAIGVLVGALTIGSAGPNLLRLATNGGEWRVVVLGAAAAASVSALLFFVVVKEGPFQAPSALFESGALLAVLRDRGVILATGGYLGHMWELYAMWSSIGVFWTYAAVVHRIEASTAAVLAFLTIAAGTAGCIVAGIAADRVGRPKVTIIAMLASGACAMVIGSLVTGSLVVLVTVALIWGATIVADSAQFSAAVTELAPSRYVGTAITLQTCAGFLLTIVTIRLVPVWVEWWGWERAYMPLAIGPALGVLAMWRLSRDTRLASRRV